MGVGLGLVSVSLIELVARAARFLLEIADVVTVVEARERMVAVMFILKRNSFEMQEISVGMLFLPFNIC